MIKEKANGLRGAPFIGEGYRAELTCMVKHSPAVIAFHESATR